MLNLKILACFGIHAIPCSLLHTCAKLQLEAIQNRKGSGLLLDIILHCYDIPGDVAPSVTEINISRDHDSFLNLIVEWRDAATSIHVSRDSKIVFQDGMFMFFLTVIRMLLMLPTVVKSMKEALLALQNIYSDV